MLKSPFLSLLGIAIILLVIMWRYQQRVRRDVVNNNYVPDSYYTAKVNTDPNTPGILAKYKITAGNVSKEKTVYVGGLPAYKKATDLGGTWSVAGLSDLAKASGSTSNWHYEW